MSARNILVSRQPWTSGQVGFQGNPPSTEIDDIKRDLQSKKREIHALKEEIKQLKENKELNDAKIKDSM